MTGRSRSGNHWQNSIEVKKGSRCSRNRKSAFFFLFDQFNKYYLSKLYITRNIVVHRLPLIFGGWNHTSHNQVSKTTKTILCELSTNKAKEGKLVFKIQEPWEFMWSLFSLGIQKKNPSLREMLWEQGTI